MKCGVSNKRNYEHLVSRYNSECQIIEELLDFSIPVDENDFIGAVYQSIMLEGKKNTIGSYYTPKIIAENLTKELDFSNNQTFFDPCCGSGSFFLSLENLDPLQIYGIDSDPIAVMIASFNHICKFPNIDFEPQIYCYDYLESHNLLNNSNNISDMLFNYICTNPPWGAVTNANSIPCEITSKESFSCFWVKAFSQLKSNGIIRFLFPESILNVKIHRDIREFMLNECCLEQITSYNNNFTGVVTSYIDIKASNSKPKNSLIYHSCKECRSIKLSTFKETNNLVFNLLSADDVDIIQKVKNKGKYDLSKSIWALGIVTGDNKNKLFSNPALGMEAIYTGKEIDAYVLKPAKNYLTYDRNQLQQVAKDEYYRAPEKLIDKFISDKLTFAYDNTKSLFLNSANILIPNIPNMSVKTVMAFLNSELYQYLYIKLFGEIKILKGNLIELPFPHIDKNTNDTIEALVNQIIYNKTQDLIDELQKEIYNLFEIDNEQRKYISAIVDQ